MDSGISSETACSMDSAFEPTWTYLRRVAEGIPESILHDQQDIKNSHQLPDGSFCLSLNVFSADCYIWLLFRELPTNIRHLESNVLLTKYRPQGERGIHFCYVKATLVDIRNRHSDGMPVVIPR